MSCRALLKNVPIVTVLLFHFTIQVVESCNINDVINLVHYNENYQEDPCYVEWNTAHGAELARSDRWEELERIQQMWDVERPRNEKESVPKYFSPGLWEVFGIFVGLVVGICCLAACVAASQNKDNLLTTTRAANFLRRHISPQQGQVTPEVSNNPLGYQLDIITTNHSNSLTDFDVFPSLSSYQDPCVDAQAPSPMLKRQNSLPSYDDAVKMPTAPPIE